MKNLLPRKLLALLLALTMVVSVTTPLALADEPNGEKNVYKNGNFTAEKLSNPTTGEGEADGLNGDRLNSYAWSMEELNDEYGDYVYIGSNRNILYASATSGLVGGDGNNEAMVKLIDAITNGELETDCKQLDFAHAVIVRYNLKTGEMETYFNSADHEQYIPDGNGGFIFKPDEGYGLVSGFRAVKKFKGNLYFNALSSGATYIYRISDNNQELPEIVYKQADGGFMRAMTVSEDGNTLYMGGTTSAMSTNVQEGDWAIKVVKSTTGDLDSFETIADWQDFTRYEKGVYRTSGGDVWDMLEYNGELYMTIMTMKGAMCFKAHEAAPWEWREANEYGWVWEEFCGEDPGSPYGPGFGNPENYAMTPYLYHGDVYFIGFSNAMDAIINAIIGLLGVTSGDKDINDFFDSLKDMEAVLDNETAVFRMHKDGSVEMVVGDPGKCDDNIPYVGTMKAGFNDDEYSTTNYNWRAAVYNDKFYIGTFDSYPMFKYVTKLTNGDLLNMSGEEFRSQLEYVKTFLELILAPEEEPEPEPLPLLSAQPAKLSKPEAVKAVAEFYNDPVLGESTALTAGGSSNGTPAERLSDAAIDSLLDALVILQQNMDKEAVTKFLSSTLSSIPETKKALGQLFDYLTFLQKYAPSDIKPAIGQVKSLVAGLKNALGDINEEGIQRYVRISDTLAANSNPGCELYCTKDGVNYETVTLNGFQDEYNYGVRTLLTTDSGLLVGTANPFFGAQLWRVTEPSPSRSSSGKSATTYSITCDDGVTANRKKASANTTITLTVEDDAFIPVVTDKKDNSVQVTEKDGKYTFKMPKSAVTVSLSAKPVEPVEPVSTVCPKDDTCPIDKFTDTKNDEWWHDGIHYCLDNKLMKGTEETLFEPESPVSRGQLVTILYRLAGEPAFMNDNVFPDVEAGAYYEKPIVWASGKDVVNGYGPEEGNRFGPNDNVTREQFAAILYRYATKIADVDTDKYMEDTNTLSFDDIFTVNDYAKDAVNFCIAAGILNGDEGKIKPQNNTSRAEAATMLYRFCENVLK